MSQKKYIRICPGCSKEIEHLTKHILNQSIKENRLCKSCAQTSNNNHNFGKHLSEDTKKKLSKSCSLSQTQRFMDVNERKNLSNIQIRRYTNLLERKKTSIAIKLAMHRPDVRKNHLNALHHSNWVKVRTDKGQLEILQKWNSLGFKFEPNFRIKTDTELFYVDGYDKIHNVVFEYDSKYHMRPVQKQKDLDREKSIINILKPKKFWRYNVVTQKIKNVLGK